MYIFDLISVTRDERDLPLVYREGTELMRGVFAKVYENSEWQCPD
jgi:hypothetical protein